MKGDFSITYFRLIWGIAIIVIYASVITIGYVLTSLKVGFKPQVLGTALIFLFIYY